MVSNLLFLLLKIVSDIHLCKQMRNVFEIVLYGSNQCHVVADAEEVSKCISYASSSVVVNSAFLHSDTAAASSNPRRITDQGSCFKFIHLDTTKAVFI